jgi:4,5-DOPA dioxygenase extradiol
MKREDFLKTLALLPIAGYAMKLNQLETIAGPLKSTDIMPVLFLGHGSPMNAIEQNEFTRGWQKTGETIPKPTAILCISAHWETRGTFVTAMEKPQTIHDFGGFPQALFNVQYPAPGKPELARETQQVVTATQVGLDYSWGLDHGAWSVIKHLYPAAVIPVIQMSIDYTKPPQYHYDLGKQLAALRNKGVLIIGSGNMVHNLRMIEWDKPESGSDWAVEANTLLKKLINTDNHEQLIDYGKLGRAVELSVPTPEHYLPLLYVLALKNGNENVSLFNDKEIMGSLSMTSVRIDQP